MPCQVDIQATRIASSVAVSSVEAAVHLGERLTTRHAGMALFVPYRAT